MLVYATPVIAAASAASTPAAANSQGAGAVWIANIALGARRIKLPRADCSIFSDDHRGGEAMRLDQDAVTFPRFLPPRGRSILEMSAVSMNHI